jgi:hypothetical protein
MYELNETCSGKPLMDSKLWFILNYAIRKVVYFIFAVITVISLRFLYTDNTLFAVDQTNTRSRWRCNWGGCSCNSKENISDFASGFS